MSPLLDLESIRLTYRRPSKRYLATVSKHLHRLLTDTQTIIVPIRSASYRTTTLNIYSVMLIQIQRPLLSWTLHHISGSNIRILSFRGNSLLEIQWQIPFDRLSVPSLEKLTILQSTCNATSACCLNLLPLSSGVTVVLQLLDLTTSFISLATSRHQYKSRFPKSQLSLLTPLV